MHVYIHGVCMYIIYQSLHVCRGSIYIKLDTYYIYSQTLVALKYLGYSDGGTYKLCMGVVYDVRSN